MRGHGLSRSALYVLRQLAFGAGGELEGHPGALLEGFEALHGDGGKVRENVCAAAVGFDKAETLCIIEPFDSASRHSVYLVRLSTFL